MKRKATNCPEGQHGPVYNVTGAGLAGYRKAAKDGLAGLDREARQQYGAAVEAAILEMQRRQFIRESTEANTRPNCASGSWDENPSDAVRRQHNAALLACPTRERAARTPHEWESMYEEAMELKAAAIAERVLAGNSIWEIAA